MSHQAYLFWSDHRLSDYLERRLQAMADAVDRVPVEHAMQADPEAWADALAESHKVLTPELGELWMSRPQEIKVDVSHEGFRRDIRDPSRPFYTPGYRVTLHIPFEGDPEVFELRTATYTLSLCDGSVRGDELIKTIEYAADSPADIDGEAQRWLRDVNEWLGWAASEITTSNERFDNEARRLVERRCERITNHRAQLAQIKTPIGPPGEREKKSIDEVIVRLPSPVPKLAQATQPGAIELEPALEDDVFDHILEIVRATGTAMEKTPATYSEMDEEARRDVFVTSLNTHYRGQTAAEAFNRNGHTDILITYETKNLFIGECKIWRGAQSLNDATDQLFSYTAWRDTKTALVFFVGEKGFSEIIDRARDALASHPQFKAWRSSPGESESRATMTWPGDDQREIDLALTLFHIP